MKKILILGGAGFAGVGLTTKLLERGDQVTILDTIAQSHSALASKKVFYRWKAIHDLVPKDLEGYDAIVHCAAQSDAPMAFGSPRWTVYQNVNGTVHLLEAAREADFGRLINASSGNEYGRATELPIKENHPLTPHNPYAFSKAAQELACMAWHRCYGMPLVIVSNGIVTGPGMRREIFLFKWLYNILRGEAVVLEGGDQTRDITYVDDVLQAWLLAIDAPLEKINGEKFQVSFGDEMKLKDILELCLSICARKKIEVIWKPYRPGEEGQRECFDIRKAVDVLGYKPKYSPEAAIRMTVEWMKREVL